MKRKTNVQYQKQPLAKVYPAHDPARAIQVRQVCVPEFGSVESGTMTRAQALQYVGHCVDDALAERSISEIPANARLIGWQCGFEPMFVAVWSYLDVRLDEQEAEELAIDLLTEKHWFSGNPTPADYII